MQWSIDFLKSTKIVHLYIKMHHYRAHGGSRAATPLWHNCRSLKVGKVKAGYVRIGGSFTFIGTGNA